MMKDISEKLKPGGKIYILEAFSLKERTIYCDDHHKGYRIDEVIDIMSKQGFYLTMMRHPESNIVNYANCLVFEKDTTASTQFYTTQKKVQPLCDMTRTFDDRTVVCDLESMARKTDSLQKCISDITAIYSAYESWLRDIGIMWMKKRDYVPACQVFKTLCSLYPESVLNHISLASAYEANKQNEYALSSYKKAYEMDKKNKEVNKKIKKLSVKN